VRKDEWRAFLIVAAAGCLVVLIVWLTGWPSGTGRR
jgi:hypothetical protein